MLSRHLTQRGDTIIEVLLAISVFSLVSILSMAIMQRGSSTAQRAVEITQVREVVDSQAEALRAAHAEYARIVSTGGNPAGSVWSKIATAQFASYGASIQCPTAAFMQTKVAALNPRATDVLRAGSYSPAGGEGSSSPFSQIAEKDGELISYGVWIERVKTDFVGKVPGMYTFRVRACWDDPGGSVPIRLETTVRLYEI